MTLAPRAFRAKLILAESKALPGLIGAAVSPDDIVGVPISRPPAGDAGRNGVPVAVIVCDPEVFRVTPLVKL
jgi:hypothetical protein